MRTIIIMTIGILMTAAAHAQHPPIVYDSRGCAHLMGPSGPVRSMVYPCEHSEPEYHAPRAAPAPRYVDPGIVDEGDGD